jgi:hypothetical protein
MKFMILVEVDTVDSDDDLMVSRVMEDLEEAVEAADPDGEKARVIGIQEAQDTTLFGT